MRTWNRRWSVALAVLVGAAAAACDAPSAERAAPAAPSVPDSFLVEFETNEGTFVMELHRNWSPAGVERILRLVEEGYWDGARVYRVNQRYAQFGYSGRPALDSAWVERGLPDEPVRSSNVRGSVSFARGGPGTRSVVLFVNRTDNGDLDALAWRGVEGFPPVGRIRSGMEVVDALFDGYADDPLEWEDSIAALGNPFLDRRYPQLDSIVRARIVEDWS